jgi:hypothetical protein
MVLTVAVPLVALKMVRDYGVTIRVPVLVQSRVRLGVPTRVRVEGWVPWTLEGRKVWDRTYVRPLALAADAVLGTSHRPEHAARWVRVPRDFRDQDGSPVEVLLPESFTGADRGTQDRLVRTVASRLGLRDPAVQWQLTGSQPRVLFSAPPVPPTKVRWADVERFFLESEEYRPFLGLATRGAGLYAEMVSDSPHIGLSAGSGAGKSELVKSIIMQALRWGWGVVILDWKEVSQDWADGLPGVRIIRDIQDIHDWLVRLGGDLDERKKAYRQDRDLPGRAKVLVVYEEMNATSDLLAAYWADLRATAEPDEKRTMPAKSPALRAQNALVFGGRQFGIHCLFMAQRFSNRVTQGNTDIRENFQIRLMARYSPATVKMLAPDIKPFPKKPINLGAWVAVMGQEAVVFQAPLITTEEAREYALGGVENPDHPLTRSYLLAGSERQSVDGALGDQLRHVGAPGLALTNVIDGEVLTPVDERKLSEMVDGLAHLGVTLPVLQKAARADDQGDQTFPGVVGGSPNRGYTYDFQAVLEWARKRHAQRQAVRDVR